MIVADDKLRRVSCSLVRDARKLGYPMDAAGIRGMVRATASAIPGTERTDYWQVAMAMDDEAVHRLALQVTA